jgi:20S proteasome alpha/beta subunit
MTMIQLSVPVLVLFGLLVMPFVVQSSEGRGGGWGISVDDRHAFSLSTFNPQGRLQQVDYAMEAAALGTPIVILRRPQDDTLLMAAPQVLPSPFMQDDGTARFVRITSNLMIAHSGIAADGRVLCAAAQELAVQHEYIYDEEIPIDVFLEEVALLYQDYTMKPATRPFGATIVVAHYQAGEESSQSSSSSSSSSSSFYQIDPSGAVQSLLTHDDVNYTNSSNVNYAVINGGDKFQRDNQLWDALQNISQDPQPQTTRETRQKLVQALVDALTRASAEEEIPRINVKKSSSKPPPPPQESKHKTSKEANPQEDKAVDLQTQQQEEEDQRVPTTLKNVRRILTASICRKGGMVMERFELSRGKLVIPEDAVSVANSNNDNNSNNNNKPQS